MDKILASQKHNVLCVTKRFKTDSERRDAHKDIIWHQPVEENDKAEVAVMEHYDDHGVLCAETVVFFRGGMWPLLGTREGLDGMAVTLRIHCRIEHPYSVWELYTDTPVRPSVTAEKIRENARKSIGRL